MLGTLVSIVSGTYNRLNYLKRMVQSVRMSIGIGIQYEIVLVDGGSSDGTIEWCKKQPDVKLIEQGELLGAVKAFNAGAYAAGGKYVILANDDIEFVDESIVRAIAYMEDNLDIGVGCFFQDRGNQRWHIEVMPVVADGKQEYHYYGQVCIVPKWLGDRVGWWGEFYHTYGGDNELSCNILEAGYGVQPIFCACIHDAQVFDDLRKHNSDVYESPAAAAKVGKPLADTIRWSDKWTRNGMVGPVMTSVKKWPNPLPRYMRVFYAPIYEPGHGIQRKQKKGLREALARVGIVYEYDYIGISNKRGIQYCRDMTFDAAAALEPDLFIFQIQGIHEYDLQTLMELRKEHPKAHFVNWNGDYHPEVLFERRYIDAMKLFDAVGLVTTEVQERYDAEHVKWFYWQIGYEESDAEPTAETPQHDVVFLANGYSEARYNLVRGLRGMPLDFGLYGSWSGGIEPNGQTLYDFDAGQRLYRSAKLAIGDSQWPHATGFVSNRLFQSMAAGGVMLLQQKFDGMEELLGLQSGVHLDTWETVPELQEKITYWLDDEKRRKRIAGIGTNFILENHSFDKRVRELLQRLAN